MVERTSELRPDVLFRAWTEQFDFHEAVTLEPEESPVVRMALPLVTSLEKENGIDLSLHQNRSRGGKPAVELFCPGTK